MRAMKWIGYVSVLAVALAFLEGGAVASAAPVGSWTQAGRVEHGVPTAVACPSRLLCVAVDQGGNDLVTRDPGAGASAWTVSHIDPGTDLGDGFFDGYDLTDVSCPSTQLCVAVDDGGRVWTSRDPAGGASSWDAGMVEPKGLVSVSCPTTSLCVAVGGPDVAFSNDPAAGSSSWTVVRDVDQDIFWECGKYPDTPQLCYQLSLAGVSCPSSSSCLALDGQNGGVHSVDPGSAGGWPSVQGGNYNPPFDCPSTSLCIESCSPSVDVGFDTCSTGDNNDDAQIVSLNPSTPQRAHFHTVAPSALTSLWCSLPSCYGASDTGELVGSSDPGDRHAWWQRLFATGPANRNNPVINALACVSSRLCLALTSAGGLLKGAPPATRVQVRSALKAVLTQGASKAQLRQLIRNHGYREKIHTVAPGRLKITWTDPHTHITVARGERSFTQAATTAIHISLTRQGILLLQSHARTKIIVHGSFAPDGTSPVSTTSRLVVPMR
jgi:hypothetical protein